MYLVRLFMLQDRTMAQDMLFLCAGSYTRRCRPIQLLVGELRMRDVDMATEQPVSELAALRTRVAELEAADGRRRRAEAALHLSDRILEQMPDAILFMDGEGTIRR